MRDREPATTPSFLTTREVSPMIHASLQSEENAAGMRRGEGLDSRHPRRTRAQAKRAFFPLSLQLRLRGGTEACERAEGALRTPPRQFLPPICLAPSRLPRGILLDTPGRVGRSWCRASCLFGGPSPKETFWGGTSAALLLPASCFLLPASYREKD